MSTPNDALDTVSADADADGLNVTAPTFFSIAGGGKSDSEEDEPD